MLLVFSLLQRFALPAVALSLVACASSGPTVAGLAAGVSPYKIDIIQGNVVTREQVQVLRAGMSRPQVRDVLGSPLLTSVFHGDRWDYVFTLQRQGAPAQSRRVTVFFRGDTMDRVEADDLPSEKEFVSTLRTQVPQGPAPVLEAPAADAAAPQSAPAAKVAAPTATAAPQDAVANYPPLEASR